MSALANTVVASTASVPLTPDRIAALDKEMRREPDHNGTTCSPGWGLIRPYVLDRRISHCDGYHRAGVRTVVVEWGVTVQIGTGQAYEGGDPVVHLRALENDCNGELPYDVVMSPDEALTMATELQRTARAVRREITGWYVEGGDAR